MADFASALHDRVEADAGVSAMTSEVHLGIVPEGTALPYIRLNVISDPRPMDLESYTATREARVQVDCFAKGYREARELAGRVIIALATPAAFGGVMFGRIKASGPIDEGEDTPKGYIHRARLDLLAEHRETS